MSKPSIHPLPKPHSKEVDAMERSVYNQHWEADWDDMKNYGPYARHMRRLILELLHPLKFDTVLDVGCGQGALLADVATLFPNANLYGSDFSMAALQMAQRRLPNAAFTIMDLTQNSFHSSFDVVLCTDVLEHIEDDVTAIRNLAQLTRRYLLIATVQGRMRAHEPEAWGHVRNYRYGELVQKLESADLKVIKTIEWGFPLFSPIYRDINAVIGGAGTSGKYGLVRKGIAELIYQMFRLNRTTHGDEIFVLAERT